MGVPALRGLGKRGELGTECEATQSSCVPSSLVAVSLHLFSHVYNTRIKLLPHPLIQDYNSLRAVLTYLQNHTSRLAKE